MQNSAHNILSIATHSKNLQEQNNNNNKNDLSTDRSGIVQQHWNWLEYYISQN